MKKIICLMCATALLSSCHIYKSYDRPEDMTTAGLYRDTASVNDTLAADTANFGNLPWREVFTDPQLQTLIEQALTNNGDLRSAALNVKQAQAALMSARLADACLVSSRNRQQLGQGKGYTKLLPARHRKLASRPLRSTAEPEATSKG